MTKGELLRLLEDEAKKYRKLAFASIERSRHMNDLSETDFAKLRKSRQLIQKTIDALLVDFINFVGAGQCIDYGLHTRHFDEKAKMVLHHDDPPCRARLNYGFSKSAMFFPDTQSRRLLPYCPLSCDCPLKNLKCPKCKRTFKRPAR